MELNVNLSREATQRGLEIYFFELGNNKRQRIYNLLAAVFIVINIPLLYFAYKMNSTSNMVISGVMIVYFSFLLYTKNGTRRHQTLKKFITKNYDKLIEKNPEFPFETTLKIEVYESLVQMEFDTKKIDVVDVIEEDMPLPVDGDSEEEFEDIEIDNTIESNPGHVSVDLKLDVKLVETEDMYVYIPVTNMPIIIDKSQLSDVELQELQSLITLQEVTKIKYNF